MSMVIALSLLIMIIKFERYEFIILGVQTFLVNVLYDKLKLKLYLWQR